MQQLNSKSETIGKTIAGAIRSIEEKIIQWQELIDNMKRDFPESNEFLNAPTNNLVETYTRKPQVAPDGYNKNDGLTAKFAYFLRRCNRFVHLREVADWIVEADNMDPESNEAKKLASHISASIGILKQNGSIVKFVADSKKNTCTYWGLPKWLDEEGNIIPNYKYNNEYPKGRGKKSTNIELW